MPFVSRSFLVCGFGGRFFVLFLGKTSFRKTLFFLSGACRGRCPFLGLLSTGPLGKTPFGVKTFSIRKNPWPFGKTFTGKNSFRKTHYLFEKDLLRKIIRKTHLGKTYSFSCTAALMWSLVSSGGSRVDGVVSN